MANNLFVSYDLHEPGKNYGAVTAAIQSISGRWAKIHYSLWYVKTDLTAEQAAQRIRLAMDQNDSLIVIEARNAYWYHLSDEVSKYVQNNWHS